MSFNYLSFNNSFGLSHESNDLVEFINQFKVNEVIIIAPSLDAKKNLVDVLAKKNGTVPDNLVLRLSEFFSHLVSKIKPDIEFLDKKLFQIYLKQELLNLGMAHTDQFQIEKAIEYISVYAPILAHPRYRVIFEEYISEDDIFNNIYSEMYPLMTKIWDFVLSSPYLIKQWSLGYMFENIDKLTESEMNIVIYKIDSLKKVEIDFFEELSNYWPVYVVEAEVQDKASNSNINNDSEKELTTSGLNQGVQLQKYKWHKVTTPLEEVELLAKLIFEKSLDWNDIKIIIPKKRIEYIKVLEVYLSHYFALTIENTKQESRFNFHLIRSNLNKLLQLNRKLSNKSKYNDILASLDEYKGKFKNYSDFFRNTSHLVDIKQLKSNLQELDSKETKISFNNATQGKVELKKLTSQDFELKISYYDFVNKINKILFSNLGSEELNSNNSQIKNATEIQQLDLFELESIQSVVVMDKEVIENKADGGLSNWLGEQIILIPSFIRLSFENWCLYAENLVKSKVEHDLTKTNLPIQFLEDVEFNSAYTYFILGCTQQNYESSSYAYLSNIEIDKLKFDLGFNFESKEFSEQFFEEFSGILKSDFAPTIHFISPAYSLKSEKENDAKFLTQLDNLSLCESIIEKNDSFLFFEKSMDLNVSDVSLNPETLEKLMREYQSASSLQKYIDCPYIYFNEYVLSSKKTIELDLEPNAILKGKVYHNSLETYLDKPSVSLNEIEGFIKNEISKEYKNWQELRSIQEQMKMSSLKIQSYIQRDHEIKKEEGRKTVYKELDFISYFDIENLKFSRTKNSKSNIQIKGKIDRIDTIGDKIYIFDYKLSDGKSFNEWKTNYLVQMPIYGLMFIDNVLPIEGELSQLSYIAINKDFKYKNGLSMNQGNEKLNLGMHFNKANSHTNYDNYCNELDIFRELLKLALQGIQNSKFSPAPYNANNCIKCDWKDSCHAKHLY
jgi:hypothetical protein